ncbi:MAG: MFS transporter [Chthoniobacteraceae bacterium]
MKTGTASRSLAQDVRLREVWAWSMYDFANSGYTTVVITAVFNAYFVSAIAGKAPWATFAWTAALSVSYLAVLLTAPIVGAWADAHAAKKKLLLIATIGCVFFTGLMFFATPGAVAFAIFLIIVSNFFFGTGENLIAAFLTELADSKAMGRVSGWGWAFGYLGGLVSLGVALAYILSRPKDLPATEYVPIVMLITAVIFALASIPTFLYLRERARPHREQKHPWQRVMQTLRQTARFQDLRRFLVCILFYQAGIQAVIALAAIYATEAMKFTFVDTIILILVVNITAAIGAFSFGYLQDRIGHIRSMQLVLVGYLSPPDRNAEFFGLWGLAVKAASIFGPLTYGTVTWIFEGNHRLAILAVGVYFVIGLALLAGINVERGRRSALSADGA